AGLKARVAELRTKHLQGHTVLKGQRHGRGHAIHESRDGGTLLGHGDEDFSRHAVLIETYGQVTLLAAHREVVRKRLSLVGQPTTKGLGDSAIVANLRTLSL